MLLVPRCSAVLVIVPLSVRLPHRQGCPLRFLHSASLRPCPCVFLSWLHSLLSRHYSVRLHVRRAFFSAPRFCGSVRATFIYSPVASLSANFQRLPSVVSSALLPPAPAVASCSASLRNPAPAPTLMAHWGARLRGPCHFVAWFVNSEFFPACVFLGGRKQKKMKEKKTRFFLSFVFFVSLRFACFHSFFLLFLSIFFVLIVFFGCCGVVAVLFWCCFFWI